MSKKKNKLTKAEEKILEKMWNNFEDNINLVANNRVATEVNT